MKIVKLDPKKVTYNGKSINLVIPNREEFIKELQMRQKQMELEIITSNKKRIIYE